MKRAGPTRTGISPKSRRPPELKFHLQDIMDEHGFTYTDVSHLTGIPISTLSEMGRGIIAVPGAEHLVNLCRSLDVSVGELLEVTPTQK